MPREWDATTYDTLPLPHQQWGRRMLDRLPLAGDETVMDAGCGTGRDTELLLGLEPGEQFHGYLATVVLGAYLTHLPESEHDAFVRAVPGRLPEPVVDYVRLTMTAVRAHRQPDRGHRPEGNSPPIPRR